jgi:hypothetical protein
MSARLDPVQIRRLLARTLRVALDGAPAASQLVDRWAAAEAPDEAWIVATTWDGIGAAVGWALETLDLRDVAPAELALVTAEAFAEAREQSVQLSADLLRLGTEFEAIGIPAVVLKGSALLAANVAPSLGVRWMRDLDILVPEPHVETASWILESLDYAKGFSRDQSAPEVHRPYHESFESPDGRMVELHWRLGPQRWGRAAAAEDWFRRAGPCAVPGLLVPAPADLFWHFLLHDARNHAWSSGSLRATFDLALAARAPGFALAEVISRLNDDPLPGPLLEAIADAANLSPILAAEVEPTPRPRYVRLANWREMFGKRRWRTDRIAEAIAWGATFDRARRFGGWRGLLERATRVIPEAEPGQGALATVRRLFLNMRHAAFVGALALGHYVALPLEPGARRRALPRPPRRDTA